MPGKTEQKVRQGKLPNFSTSAWPPVSVCDCWLVLGSRVNTGLRTFCRPGGPVRCCSARASPDSTRHFFRSCASVTSFSEKGLRFAIDLPPGVLQGTSSLRMTASSSSPTRSDSAEVGLQGDEELSCSEPHEVQVHFSTNLPEIFQLPDHPFVVPSAFSRLDLSRVSRVRLPSPRMFLARGRPMLRLSRPRS